MSRIRPLTDPDLPAVARLRIRVFEKSRWDSAAALESYFRRVFFESPWVDQTLPSYVLEDGGAVVGFVGVIPRTFVLEGQPLRGAVMTQLMAAPEVRGGAGRRLVRQVLEGAQDFTLTDVPNEACTAIWQQLGGHTASVYGFRWSRPVRPARHAAAGLGMAPIARAGRLLARPVLGAIDRVVAASRDPRRGTPRPDGAGEELDPSAAADAFPSMVGNHVLHARYDARTLAWVLDHLAEYHPRGVDRAAVVDRSGRLEGWYVTTRNPGGPAELIHLVAGDQAYRRVLEHALRGAYRSGAVTLQGRYDPRYSRLLASLGARFRLDGPPVLVHSKQPGLVEAVLAGRGVLTGLEGEWWLSF